MGETGWFGEGRFGGGPDGTNRTHGTYVFLTRRTVPEAWLLLLDPRF
jgi:hypothetical protein